MIRKSVWTGISLGMLLVSLAGTATASPSQPGGPGVATPRPDGAVGSTLAAGLSCGWGDQCNETDPGNYSWEVKDTDDRVSDPGCATLEIRSGRKDGAWYAWPRLTVASGCGYYQGWIDRSFDDGQSWERWGFFETEDSNYGNMVYWPDNAKVRAGFKHRWEDWSDSGLTKWHG
ncbi:hypothetical protein AB0I68_33145 [Streptomyces sp. NPDC050448]|uniref:hypothetical protein n=1 Tax=Streptomyces sp. NPDC050448 TaxID=3155404 RepID=UPI003415D65B